MKRSFVGTRVKQEKHDHAQESQYKEHSPCNGTEHIYFREAINTSKSMQEKNVTIDRHGNVRFGKK